MKIVIYVMCAVALLCAVSLRYVHSSDYTVAGYDIACSEGGVDNTITFEICDDKGNPISGVIVDSQSHSGWAGSSVTDASGRATIVPGEREVLAVSLNGTEVSFERGWFLSDFFVPSCKEGLSVTIVKP